MNQPIIGGKHDPEHLAQIVIETSRAIERNPQDAQAWFRRGNARSNQGRYEDAKDDLTQVIALDPDNSMAWNNRGIAFLCTGNADSAVSDISKAIALDSEIPRRLSQPRPGILGAWQPRRRNRRSHPRPGNRPRFLERLPPPQHPARHERRPRRQLQGLPYGKRQGLVSRSARSSLACRRTSPQVLAQYLQPRNGQLAAYIIEPLDDLLVQRYAVLAPVLNLLVL